MSRERRVEVGRDEQTPFVLAQVPVRLCDLLVVEVHVQAAHDGADFRVLRDGRKVHQVDKDVVFGILSRRRHSRVSS